MQVIDMTNPADKTESVPIAGEEESRGAEGGVLAVLDYVAEGGNEDSRVGQGSDSRGGHRRVG